MNRKHSFILPWHVEPGVIKENITIWTTADGTIYCSKCKNLNWCMHIKAALENHLDSTTIWETDRELEPIGHVMIPIYPEKSIWTEVSLFKVEIDTPVYEVIHIGTTKERRDFLGYIHPGEARQIIRSLIVDWFQGVIEPNEYHEICVAAGHNYKQEIIYKENMKRERIAFAERWCIWSTGECLTCHTGAVNFDDLVPIPESRSWGTHAGKSHTVTSAIAGLAPTTAARETREMIEEEWRILYYARVSS